MSKKIEAFFKKIIEAKYSQWIIIILAIGVYGILCFGKTIWLDEAITANFVRLSFTELIKKTAMDVHPPLYYILIKVAILIGGDHLYVMKLASMLPFIFVLILSYRKVTVFWGNKVAFFFSAFMSALPCVMHKNVEIRMYQWGMFFVTAFGIYLVAALLESNKINWILTVFWGICAAYTHYYALIAVAILYIFFFLFVCTENRQRIRIIISCFISGVVYFPWLIILLSQMKTIHTTGWWNTTKVSFTFVKDLFFFPVGEGNIFLKSVYLVVMILSLITLVISKDYQSKKIAFSYIGVYWGIGIFGILITIFYQPIFLLRFIYPCVGLLILGICISFKELDFKFEIIALGVFLLFSMKPYYKELCYQFNKNSVPVLEEFVEKNEKDAEEKLLITDDGAIDVFLDYFASQLPHVDKESINCLEKSKYKDIYFFTFKGKFPDKQLLKKVGCSSYQKIDEVEIRYHSFDIYKLL